jgi:hypothetical protein
MMISNLVLTCEPQFGVVHDEFGSNRSQNRDDRFSAINWYIIYGHETIHIGQTDLYSRPSHNIKGGQTQYVVESVHHCHNPRGW